MHRWIRLCPDFNRYATHTNTLRYIYRFCALNYFDIPTLNYFTFQLINLQFY